MKQRLGLAAALLRPRDLLVLDEPTNGLDPQGTREVRSLIRGLADGGATVFVSSHLLAEIEQICSHAAVLSLGRLVAQGTLDELRQRDRARVVVRTPDAAPAAEALSALGLTPEVRRAGEEAEVVALLGDGVALEAVVPALVAAGARVHGLRLDEPTLEERFVALTGEGFDVAF
jgi:ABC-2 type transport system ATP-binding protein